jgi:hypothetical protein
MTAPTRITDHVLSAGWLIIAQSTTPLLYSIFAWITATFTSFLIDVSEYRHSRNRKGMVLVLKALEERGRLKMGMTIFYRRSKVSAITIGPSFIAFANISRYEHHEDMSIIVYTPKWRDRIISDDEASCVVPPDHLSVIEPGMMEDRSIRRSYVLTTPPVITRHTTAVAKLISDKIVDIVLEACTGKKGNVFIVSGPPGVGKTFAGRVVGSRMQATFYNDYDPRLKESLFDLADLTVSKEQKLVFMLNECDIVFKELDKMTRNTILDKVNDNPQKYVMILTTNSKLEDLFAEDPSMIRSGRMIKMEVTDDCSDVRMVTDDMLKDRLTVKNTIPKPVICAEP